MRHGRGARRRVRQLRHADVALVEPGLAVREVEAPQPGEAIVEAEVGQLGCDVVEVRAPAPQGLGVVAAEVGAVVQRELAAAIGGRGERADRRETTAREDRGLDEVGAALEPVEAVVGHDDRLHRQRSFVGEQRARVFEERVVLPPVDGFDHLDRDDLVERSAHTPVVRLEHRDPVGETGAAYALARELELAPGNGCGGDPAAVVLGRVECEAPPARADLEEPVAGREPGHPGDAFELRPRRVRQSRSGSVEDRAGIGHRVVEDAPEEFVADVVVRAHVPEVARRVGAVHARDRVDERAQCTVDAILSVVERLQAVQREPQEAGEIVGVPPPVGVRLAQPDAPVPQHAFVDARVVHFDPRPVRRIGRDGARVRVRPLDDRSGNARSSRGHDPPAHAPTS